MSKADKGRADRLSPDQLLRAYPVANRDMQLETRQGGVLASVPIRRPRYMVPPLSWLLPFSDRRRVELDRLGAEVLAQCDGNHSVEAMIESFAATHKLSFREAQMPVIQFLKSLMQRGLVVIVGMNEDAHKA